MCGIVGAVAGGDVAPRLLEGLRRLEYRGYDSAGLAVISASGAPAQPSLRRLRVVGKVAALERALAGREQEFAGPLGIAHTRWATHGAPQRRNAHPHLGRGRRIAVVHNGIIENHQELRDRLQKRGYRFRSATDTEVIVHLLEDSLQLSRGFTESFATVLKVLEGAYALAVIGLPEPGLLLAARRGSPLVLGIGEGAGAGEGGCYLASDAMALPPSRRCITLEDGDIAGATTLPAAAGDVAAASGILTFAMDETVKTFTLTPARDMVSEVADDDFIVITLSGNMPPETTVIGAPNPLRIRITDVADDPRLREQRLEVAGAMLTRAAMILAIPTISRRLDPDSGALAPGLALTVSGRQVVAGGGKEGVAPVPFTGIGIVMPAQSPTPRQLLNMPADGDDGGAALQGLEGIVIAAASANESLSPRQLLGDSGFALAQGESGARTGTVIWGRGGYTKLEGEPVIGGELADYKGDAWTFYLGADRRYGNFLIGMAAGYTHGDLELDANILPGLPGTSTFEQDMVSIVPYAAWQPSRAVSVWVLGGYGRGEVDIIEQEAGGTRREGASDSDLLLGAAGLTLRRPSRTPVDILLRLSTTAAQGTIEGGRLTGDSTVPPGDYGETTTNAQQVQAELELAGRFGAMAGTHVRPFLLLGAAQDFGDAAPNAVTGELGGGFDLLWPKLGLESNLKLQARITNKDGQISRRKYKEYLLTGGLRYDFGNDRRGLMLSLQPEFGATANTHALAGGAAIADAAAGALRRSLRRSLHGELAYGIGDARFWGTPGIVTIYGNGNVSGRQRQYGSGLRFEARRFALSAGAKRTRRSDGRPGYEFLLDGEYSF